MDFSREKKTMTENNAREILNNAPNYHQLEEFPSGRLTFLAEAFGVLPYEEALPLLQQCLKHDRPIVREGAIYGLSSFIDRPEVRAILLEALNTETSSPIIDIITEILKKQ